ncbi:hypothetical protein [Enterovirga sp. CN4-39]|uniref:hypothetical protein n=1 Tax=Enterovirga sp. CN4-39 TaxID=3400910 RepID=UPI003C0412D5
MSLNQAKALFEQKRYGEAQRALAALQSPEAGSVEALTIRGQIAGALKNWIEAAQAWEAAAQQADSAKDRQIFTRRLAEAARKSGQMSKAKQVLAQHLETFPKDKLAWREVAHLKLASENGGQDGKYWSERKEYIYYVAVKQIAERIAGNAYSILDVGSNATPVLDWFPEVPIRHSVDVRRPYKAEGIRSFKADFLNWEPKRRKFNVVLCLQVLEHLDRPREFAEKLVSMSDVAIVSVPYKWPENKTHWHKQDPVDEEKLASWFGRQPNFSYIATELSGEQRIVVVYDRTSATRWANIVPANFLYRWRTHGAELVLADGSEA